MPLNSNFNTNPYYDDYSEDKKFLRILFKPGYAVQARELTQLQTILQNQIERFGNNIFINGAKILGGKSHAQNCISIQLDPTYNGSSVDYSKFSGKTIYNSTRTKRAEVIVATPIDTTIGDPIVLLVKQMFGDAFALGDVLVTDEPTPYYASIPTSGSPIGVGQSFSIDEGVFYFGGFFIKNDAQSIAISKYSTTSASVKVGFEINEYFVTSADDSTLVDPAQQATNYQAPGADRYSVDLNLTTRSLDSEDLSTFFEIARFQSGTLQSSNKPSVYNKIGDEIAKRTFDESGNYIVNPFSLIAESNAANTSLIDLTVGAGKAYVHGYEIDMAFPQKITTTVSRNTTNISSRIKGNFGNYYYTTNHANTFNIDQLVTVDLHCVRSAQVNTTNATYISNTKIGTAQVKSIDFVTASNTQNQTTYTYAVSVFNLNVGNVSSLVQTGGDTSNVKLTANASNINQAYTGAYLRILSGPGNSETSKLVISYDGTTKNATVFPAFTTAPTSASTYSLEFNSQHVASLLSLNGTAIANSADISSTYGIDPTTINSNDQKAILFENRAEELLFNLPTTFPKTNTLSNVTYNYTKVYNGTANGTGSIVGLSPDAGHSSDTFGSASTDTEKATNYILACVSPGSSPYTAGQIIPATLYSVSGAGTSGPVINITNGSSMTYSLYATLTASTSATYQKTKTYYAANTSFIASGLTSVITGRVSANALMGQVHIQANTIVRTPDTEQSLYINDCVNLVKVLDFANNAINDTNALTAIDVTSRYYLDTGQRDSFYDHSSIRLRSGQTPPIGPIVVYVNKFAHYPGTSSAPEAPGFFSASSYDSSLYESIPPYTTSSGKYYELRDCLDFRFSVTDLTTSKAYNLDSAKGANLIKRGSDITLTYDYYLPRIDKLTLSADGRFNLLEGESTPTPKAPKNNNDSIALFQIIYPPYTNDPTKINFQTIENRRYTMQDIGILEKRIKNLEYYTSLSLLENNAVSKTDASLYGRAKNGIITDSFVDFGVVDINSNDFTAGIDTSVGELKTSTKINSIQLVLDDANSTNYTKSGSLVYLTSNSAIFAEQTYATSHISINPFNVALYVGNLRMIPSSDVWVDITTLPDLLVTDPANAQMIQTINQMNNWAEVTWGSWRTTSTGTVVTGTETREWENDKYIHWDTYEERRTTTRQVRSGTIEHYTPTTVKKSLGDRIIDTNVIPFIRNKNVVFKASAIAPVKVVYPFFDNTNISNYVSSHNYFKFNINNLSYNLRSSRDSLIGEKLQIKSGATILGNAIATLASNNVLYVTNVSINQPVNWSSGSINVFGVTSNTSLTLSTSNGYSYVTGKINASVAPTSTTFKLSDDANNATLNIVTGTTPLRIVYGTGNNQSTIITGYSAITRTVTVSPALSVVPDGTSIVQIGNLSADFYGRLAGTYYIPNGKFRTGERLFRLTDDINGNFESSTSRADCSYFAQGTLETHQETILSTTIPQKNIKNVTDNRTLVTYSERFLYERVEEKDPIAQTFFVNKVQHPDGVFISKMRFCFSLADGALPVTLQIRPTVNGYPSATQIYPFSTVSLTPDQVNTTDLPDLDDATKYTEFVFESPVHLMPGEHSFVLLSNSNKYEVWIATKDQNDVVKKTVNGTPQKVSSQPSIGSFFKSQNGSTWTADQESDMMFRIYYNQFDTTVTGSIVCQLDSDMMPTTGANVDLMILQTQDIAFARTSLNYSFDSETASGTTGYVPITPNEDFFMTDNYGRRFIKTATGPSTMKVKATISTNNPDVTPIIDLERHSILAIEQVMNTLSLSNAVMVVSNTGYYGNTNVSVSISGGGGNGATAIANVYYNSALAANVVDKIIITNGGTGYKTSPTVTLSGGSPVTYSAIASVNGEDTIRGGNSLARYVTKRITLADGFNSGDLRVYIAAHKPAGSSIDVYYKILAGGDRELWQDKKWQLMTQIDNANYYSETWDDYAELTFAPGTNGVPSNAISYNSGLSGQFNDFNSFAIKVVLSGTNTVDIPRIRDFRAIAVPASFS